MDSIHFGNNYITIRVFPPTKNQVGVLCEAFNYVELKAAGEEKLPFLQIFNQLPAIFTSHNYTSHG